MVQVVAHGVSRGLERPPLPPIGAGLSADGGVPCPSGMPWAISALILAPMPLLPRPAWADLGEDDRYIVGASVRISPGDQLASFFGKRDFQFQNIHQFFR